MGRVLEASHVENEDAIALSMISADGRVMTVTRLANNLARVRDAQCAVRRGGALTNSGAKRLDRSELFRCAVDVVHDKTLAACEADPFIKSKTHLGYFLQVHAAIQHLFRVPA